MSAPASSPPSATTAVPPPWRGALLALALAWASITILFWDTAVGMVTIWYRSETFNHCFVVPPIALWLAWRRWPELRWIPPRPAPLLLLPAAAIAVLWLLGDLVAVNSVTQFAFVTLWILAVPLLLGVRVAWALLFPLLFLYFCVPIGEFLMPQLMESTADFTVAALRFTGIPVHREGLQFVIPSGNWSVVEACSGVRYLIASLTVGTLFAYLNYQSASRRVLFVLVSLAVPIVANWLRAYMIVMLGHLSGNQLAVGVDHLIYGWVFFGVVILLMFIVGARWSEPEPALRQGSAVASAGASAGRRSVVAVWLALLLVVLLPGAAKWGLERTQLPGLPVLVPPPALAAGWQLEPANMLGYVPSFQNPSVAVNPAYASAQGVVGLYVAYYRNQDYERKLVSSENVLVRNSDDPWLRARSGVQAVSAGALAQQLRFAELRQAPPSQADRPERLLVWQMYWIDGIWTHNDYLAKVLGAWKRLSGRGDESAVVVVYAAQGGEGGSAEPLLTAFLSDNLARIGALLAAARGE